MLDVVAVSGCARKTLLVAWELGAGLRHAARVAPLAAHCLEAGWRVHLALPPDAPLAWLRTRLPASWPGRLTASAVPRLPAAGPIAPTHTLADVLALLGFADPGAVDAAARRWSRLLAALRPDLVIADFGPMAVLTTRGRVPLLVVGNGYIVPPPGDRLPPIAPWMPEAGPESRRNEERVLAAVCEAARAIGVTAPGNLAALFHGDATHVGTLPQLDPYRAHRGQGDCRFPYTVELPAEPCPWPSRPREAFVYLPRRHPGLAAVLDALARHDLAATVYAGPDGVDPPGPSVRLLRDMPSLAGLLPRVRLAVHHADLGTAHAALIAGTPQLVLPGERLEHRVTAHALWELGVAAAPAIATAGGVGEAVAAVLAEGGPARHTASVAAHLRPLATPTAMLAAVRADLHRLLSAAPPCRLPT